MAESASRATRLIAVLLVTRTRPGPKIVFCYPPNPSIGQDNVDSNGNSIDPADESDTDSGGEGVPTPLRQTLNHGVDWTRGRLASTTQGTSNSTGVDDILGFSEDSLEKLLSPGCWCDRQKFEVNLDSMTFVGHPIYAAQDGSWAHKHTHETTPRKKVDKTITHSESAPLNRGESYTNEGEQPGITIIEPNTPSRGDHDFVHMPESFETQGGLSLGTSMNSASTTSATIPEPLMSFNVIMVLGPAKTASHKLDVSDLYHHIVKKLGKALHYCQKHSSYVGIESRKFMALKAKAKQESVDGVDLCKQMVDSCELAWALKEVYEKISIGAVADIRLQEKQMSLYIPNIPKDDLLKLDIHSGLLLLEDRETLLRDLAHPDASALAYFIREHTPTKSLQKLAGRLGMSIEHVLHLARYLVTWQKARVIAPLHRYNYYVMSPEAPLHRLQEYIMDYALTFPVLLPLPEVLRYFNRTPLKFGALPPSRDHREPYMGVLAYLVRHGFFQQLKTSGWLRAPTTPKRKAAAPPINQNTRPLSVASLLSPQLRPVDDDAASVSSERTAIPVSRIESLRRKPTAATPASAQESDQGPESYSIITGPTTPSEDDGKRLQHIKDSITDAELADHLPSLFQYFDGAAVLEEIGPREGLKRSKVDAWLVQLQEAGFLLTFHHL